jgi:thiol-disulfide isomerase/thioredoxin
MKKIVLLIVLLFAGSLAGKEIQTLQIGDKAPDFYLPGIDGKTWALKDFDNDVLVLIFTANHCPTAQAYEDKIIQMSIDYGAKSVDIVAISSNHPGAVRLDELGYTDLGDSFDDMKIRARNKKFYFVYLYDGDDQAVALKYGPTATPHIFIFDKKRKLQYQGRIDDTENPYVTAKSTDAINAIDALLAGKAVTTPTTKVFGCSMKWKDKLAWAEKSEKEWAAKPVSVEMIDINGVQKLVKNQSDKYRLINVWATWCGPCVIEFPELVKMHRMYKGRNFEFVSLSADKPDVHDKVLNFLQQKNAALTNYHFNSADIYALIDAVDPEWPGALPHTILVAPGGEVIYRHTGLIDPLELRKVIVEILGRYYADNK